MELPPVGDVGGQGYGEHDVTGTSVRVLIFWNIWGQIPVFEQLF